MCVQSSLSWFIKPWGVSGASCFLWFLDFILSYFNVTLFQQCISGLKSLNGEGFLVALGKQRFCFFYLHFFMKLVRLEDRGCITGRWPNHCAPSDALPSQLFSLGQRKSSCAFVLSVSVLRGTFSTPLLPHHEIRLTDMSEMHSFDTLSCPLFCLSGRERQR